MLGGKKILLGICGSIAAYKSAFLLRSLAKEGAEVQVLMTESATRFVTPLTFSSLSGKPVYTDIVNESHWNNHVELGLWADLMMVAPITANTLAKLSCGICDDMISACYLSARCPVMIAPAMDADMWQHGAVQRNIRRLQEDGVMVMPVEYGALASGLTGFGRMAEPEYLLTRIKDLFLKRNSLTGKKILVTAGPTYEAIDPVRFIGNRSSGKMGIAITQELLARGAEVKLILGPVGISPEPHNFLQVKKVVSAEEMAVAASEYWTQADAAILAAAVADYRPAIVEAQKMKKSSDVRHLELVKTVDIAALLGETKRPGQIHIGFALETENEEDFAREKMRRKNFDAIVLNSLNDPGAGFQHDTNRITILEKNGSITRFPLKSKTEVAVNIVDTLEKWLIQAYE